MFIWLGPDVDEHPEKIVTSDGDGIWEADFTDIHNLDDGGNIDPHVYDDQGNATMTTWLEVPTRISVNIARNVFGGRNWAFGGELTITIDDGVTENPYEHQTNTWGDFFYELDDLDLLSGYTIEVADEDNNNVSYTIIRLTVTEVDEDADRVYGEADPDRTVIVGIYDSPAWREVESCSEGY